MIFSSSGSIAGTFTPTSEINRRYFVHRPKPVKAGLNHAPKILSGDHHANTIQAAIVPIVDIRMLSKVYKGQPLMIIEQKVGKLIQPGYGLLCHQGMIVECYLKRCPPVIKPGRLQIGLSHGMEHGADPTAPVFNHLHILHHAH
jgi:hypothetical protein